MVGIKDREVPRGCQHCMYFRKHIFGNGLDYSYSCVLGATQFPMPWIRQMEERASDCPLVEVPAPTSKVWIPVSERLPEEAADVICCTDAEEVFIASYLGKLDDGSECFDDDNGMMCEGDVVAWMPLPEPYKEGMEVDK